MATRNLIDDLHVRLAQHGWPGMRPAFGFTLVAAQQQQPLTSGDIASLLGVSKQAASKLVDTMADEGYVKRRPAGDDGRVKLVELTARGRKLLAAVEEIYAELEADWADVIGRKRVETMRADLTDVLLATHDGRLPAIRPTW
jgi:DNA-binding MarR family transcriptional regulator